MLTPPSLYLIRLWCPFFPSSLSPRGQKPFDLLFGEAGELVVC